MASRNSVFESVSRGIEETTFLQTYRAELQRSREGIISRPLNCTVCSINIKHRLLASRNEHALLGVLVCNSCSHKIRRTLDLYQEKNNKSFCVWCTNEDKSPSFMAKCTDCSRKFCNMCIRKNMPKERKTVLWKCFSCKPNPVWFTLRALCCESIRYAEQLKKDLEERRRTVSSSLLTAATRRGMIGDPVYQSVVTNISTMTAEGPSNMSTTVTVSTSPMLRGASVSVSVHHNAERDLFRRTSTPATRQTISTLAELPVETKSTTASDAESDFTCVVCLDQDAQLACVPCGHFCFCEACFSTYEKSYSRCPLCWKPYIRTLKIYGGSK